MVTDVQLKFCKYWDKQRRKHQAQYALYLLYLIFLWNNLLHLLLYDSLDMESYQISCQHFSYHRPTIKPYANFLISMCKNTMSINTLFRHKKKTQLQYRCVNKVLIAKNLFFSESTLLYYDVIKPSNFLTSFHTLRRVLFNFVRICLG